MQDDNTYVFLSHSHYDFDKVCRLRNLLEAEGFKPLMFFLKAFENPNFEPMLKPILMEEIDQRQRFILCRSKNSKKSEWVKFEEEYIKLKKRSYEVIDLDASDDVQIESIKRYRKRTKIFISHPSTLKTLVDIVVRKLILLGFDAVTWRNYEIDNVGLGNLGQREYSMGLDEVIEEGYVLFLFDANNDGDFQISEFQYALEKSYSLVPYTPSDQKYDDLRFLSRQYSQRISTLTVAKVQLLSLLDETMPGITTILPLKSRDPDNCVLLRFIKRFKSFDVIRKMGKTRFLESYQVLVKKTKDRLDRKSVV